MIVTREYTIKLTIQTGASITTVTLPRLKRAYVFWIYYNGALKGAVISDPILTHIEDAGGPEEVLKLPEVSTAFIESMCTVIKKTTLGMIETVKTTGQGQIWILTKNEKWFYWPIQDVYDATKMFERNYTGFEIDLKENSKRRTIQFNSYTESGLTAWNKILNKEMAAACIAYALNETESKYHRPFDFRSKMRETIINSEPHPI